MKINLKLWVGCLFALPLLAATPEKTLYNMGTSVSPTGHRFDVTPTSIEIDGKAILPVMGEIHYSRYTEKEWRTELLKMKAGGITIVATYVFWSHHESEEGKYNWSGDYDVRRFVEICGDLDMQVVLRIGPWCHGEVRNGGQPEWLLEKGCKLRCNDANYLAYAEKWYKAVSEQVKGLLWKDGGPIVGVQIENEYRGRWEHLAKLKEIAIAAGLDVPMYTRTGWPALTTPAVFGEIIPLYGDYSDGFWDRSLNDMPGDYPKGFLFREARNSSVIATEQLPAESLTTQGEMSYPYFTCELGGGMMTSYHRRINIEPMDIYAMALCKLGSGSNLLGYYMYHGGTNPVVGLNECQASKQTNHNDLPSMSYDFQAPLGEYGQVNGQYHLLRRMHLFLQCFGDRMTKMQPVFPANDSLRWCYRVDSAGHGFIFVNNYERLKEHKAQENVHLTVGKIKYPTITIPENSCFFFPLKMEMGTAILEKATAQPLYKLEGADGSITWYFTAIKGIPAKFSFSNLKKGKKNVTVQPATREMVVDKSGVKHYLFVLDEEDSNRFYAGTLNGKDCICLCDAPIVFDGDSVRVFAQRGEDIRFSILAAPRMLTPRNAVVKHLENANYRWTLVKNVTTLQPIALQEAGNPRVVSLGVAKVAEAPSDADFKQAAVWKIELPKEMEDDAILSINYIGDVARLYCDDELLTDNFYNGKPFEIRTGYYKEQLKAGKLFLKILPAIEDAPIYFQKSAKDKIKKTPLLLNAIKVREQEEVVFY